MPLHLVKDGRLAEWVGKATILRPQPKNETSARAQGSDGTSHSEAEPDDEHERAAKDGEGE
jgi:hypothetical protein